MGYYTHYAIRIKNKYNTKSNLKKLSRVIELVSGYSFEIKGSILFDSYDGGAKWYHREKDLIIISKLLPKLKIEICGKGEDEGDEWCYLYKNGKKYQGGNLFLENEDDSDFYEETDSNHCSVISCNSSDGYHSSDEDDDNEK